MRHVGALTRAHLQRLIRDEARARHVTAHQPVDDMDTGLHMRDREAVASLLGLAQHARPRLTELDQRAAPEERIEIEDLGLVDLEDIPWIAGAVLLDQAIGLSQELLCIGPA